MGAFLDKPKTEEHRESGSGNGVRYALCSMQGWRIDMEDAHTALTALGSPFDTWSFFGVFDGHAGGKVSKFCSENLLNYVMNTAEFVQLRDENVSHDLKRSIITRGLIHGFLNVRCGSNLICVL